MGRMEKLDDGQESNMMFSVIASISLIIVCVNTAVENLSFLSPNKKYFV